MRFKNISLRALISKNLMVLNTAILTLHFWCSPQKNFLGQQTFVWAKIFRRVEELENFIINFTVYLRKLTNGWNLFHKSFFLCPSSCKEPLFLKIFLILKKCFMSSIDRVLNQCICHKIELVRIKINNNLNLTHYKEMEAEGGPSVIIVSNTVELRFPVIFFEQQQLFLNKHTTKNDKFNLIHFKSAAFRVYDFKNQMFHVS